MRRAKDHIPATDQVIDTLFQQIEQAQAVMTRFTEGTYLSTRAAVAPADPWTGSRLVRGPASRIREADLPAAWTRCLHSLEPAPGQSVLGAVVIPN